MTVDLKDIMALCKRRGFVFQASEIYGGINGFWDYGPLGVELKNNIRDAWWRSMVIAPPIGPDGMPVQIVGLDSAIIQNPKVWESSGHVGGFADPMIDCKETKQRYRADHLVFYISMSNEKPVAVVFHREAEEKEIKKRLKKFAGTDDLAKFHRYDFEKLPNGYEAVRAISVGPDASEVGTLTEVKQFNLMFETQVGAVASAENKAYLRPETAQGIFLNFKNVVDSTRVRMPFGIAQIGKAYRNEVTPRNFIFRTREFEQMEMEFFCHPSEAAQWAEFWVKTRKQWWLDIGLSESQLYMRKQDHDELAHYAKEGVGTTDIDFEFPFTSPGHGEIEGVAHRCDFDLNAHQTGSGQKLEYLEPETNEKFIPHVIEPAAGLNRAFLALLCAAYIVDENRPSGMYLNLHPSMAPKKAAILPLTAKGEHPEIATKLYLELRKEYNVDLDIKQNIGKRYARQDEIGTPYCFTIDDTTVSEGTVTVRDRNTTQQERIPLTSVKEFLDQKIKAL
jgi:glycyl-tRNA synthetase